MKTQRQHLTMIKPNELLGLIHEFKELFDGTLRTWKIDPIDFELKEYATQICSQPYPLPKVHNEMFEKEVKRLVLLGGPRGSK